MPSHARSRETSRAKASYKNLAIRAYLPVTCLGASRSRNLSRLSHVAPYWRTPPPGNSTWNQAAPALPFDLDSCVTLAERSVLGASRDARAADCQRFGQKKPRAEARGFEGRICRLERHVQPDQYRPTHDVVQVRLVGRELGNRVWIRVEDVADRRVHHHRTEA